MGCEMCGRNSCAKWMHSLRAQEEFEAQVGEYAPDPENRQEGADGGPSGPPETTPQSDYA